MIATPVRRTLRSQRLRARAMRFAQGKRAEGLPAGGISVCIRGGVYRHEQSFVLEDQDSGTADAPIVYTAAEGEEVRISGGIVLPARHFLPVTDEAVRARLQAEVRDRVVQID